MSDDWNIDGGPCLYGEELRLYVAAMDGLRNGDLLPMADYLRSGFDIQPAVRAVLADAIEGRGEFRPLKLNHVNGWRADSTRDRAMRRDMAIGAFVEAEPEARGRASFARVIEQAATKVFYVSEGQVKASLRVFRRAKGTLYANLAENAEKKRRDPKWRELRSMTARIYKL